MPSLAFQLEEVPCCCYRCYLCSLPVRKCCMENALALGLLWAPLNSTGTFDAGS